MGVKGAWLIWYRHPLFPVPPSRWVQTIVDSQFLPWWPLRVEYRDPKFLVFCGVVVRHKAKEPIILYPVYASRKIGNDKNENNLTDKYSGYS